MMFHGNFNKTRTRTVSTNASPPPRMRKPNATIIFKNCSKLVQKIILKLKKKFISL